MCVSVYESVRKMVALRIREDGKSESDIKKQELKGDSEWRLGGRSCEFGMSGAQRLCSAQLGAEIAFAMHAVTEKLKS